MWCGHVKYTPPASANPAPLQPPEPYPHNAPPAPTPTPPPPPRPPNPPASHTRIRPPSLHPPPRHHPLQLLHHDPPQPLQLVPERPGDVRGEEHVGQPVQRRPRGQRLGLRDVEHRTQPPG